MGKGELRSVRTDPVCRRGEVDARIVHKFGTGTFYVLVVAASVVGRETGNPAPAVAFLEILFGAGEG